MKETILFGNGINRLSSTNLSWEDLLNDLKEERDFKDENLPNTMTYERIILDRPNLHMEILDDELKVKSNISKLMSNTVNHDYYQRLYDLQAQNYLTTNYDNSFLNSIQAHFKNQLIVENRSTEGVYSIRRQKVIFETKESYKSLWQIHGEIDKPASIMLGLDHYCGSIGKIDNFIKGAYEYRKKGEQIRELSIRRKMKEKAYSEVSWVELFFNSNIHIVGFKLDFSETDLWWIINKRARILKDKKAYNYINNNIEFYCDNIEEQKKGLLESMCVNVNIVPRKEGIKDKYVAHYESLFSTLETRINK